MAQEPVQVEPRWGAEGMFTGYRVALPGDIGTKSPDRRVWFRVSQLARDLSAPKLLERWASAPAPPSSLPRDERDRFATTSRAERTIAVEEATLAAKRASGALAALNTRQQLSAVSEAVSEDADAIAHAIHDLLLSAARGIDGHELRFDRREAPVWTAAMEYERAAATPWRVQPARWGPIAAELRTAARRLARVGVLSRRGREGDGIAVLLVALVALIAEIAAWRESTQRRRQADSARRAAKVLESCAGTNGRRYPAAGSLRVTPPEAVTDSQRQQGQRPTLSGKKYSTFRPLQPRSRPGGLGRRGTN
ncbi:hypothetical protein ORV05_07980 [Amycolatopsis cynarae]|uniref:Uncharacterized protein n=1 Tax=Amycolatopsis cynarae TaxID=2995223 RepID=A0ABY7B8G7_9PSEU|nr:hypothetical protein [Amycolatopsis sp. HUAS 11-8]WAL67704.1 hypothetical protein ORV05_07980 [Amycolatopsis sp. HUAS 11-8]